MDWHAQRAIYIILEIYQMPLIVPKPYFSLFMVASTQCHNTPKTNKVPSRKHSVITLSRNVKAKKNAKTGLEEPQVSLLKRKWKFQMRNCITKKQLSDPRVKRGWKR